MEPALERGHHHSKQLVHVGVTNNILNQWTRDFKFILEPPQSKHDHVQVSTNFSLIDDKAEQNLAASSHPRYLSFTISAAQPLLRLWWTYCMYVQRLRMVRCLHLGARLQSKPPHAGSKFVSSLSPNAAFSIFALEFCEKKEILGRPCVIQSYSCQWKFSVTTSWTQRRKHPEGPSHRAGYANSANSSSTTTSADSSRTFLVICRAAFHQRRLVPSFH